MAAGVGLVTSVWSCRCVGHIWAKARGDLCFLLRATLMGGLAVWAVALALLGTCCLAQGHKSSKRGSAGAAGVDRAATPGPRSTVTEHQTRLFNTLILSFCAATFLSQAHLTEECGVTLCARPRLAYARLCQRPGRRRFCRLEFTGARLAAVQTLKAPVGSPF